MVGIEESDVDVVGLPEHFGECLVDIALVEQGVGADVAGIERGPGDVDELCGALEGVQGTVVASLGEIGGGEADGGSEFDDGLRFLFECEPEDELCLPCWFHGLAYDVAEATRSGGAGSEIGDMYFGGIPEEFLPLGFHLLIYIIGMFVFDDVGDEPEGEGRVYAEPVPVPGMESVVAVGNELEQGIHGRC